MSKKYFLITGLLASSFIASTPASAEDSSSTYCTPGFYAGVQAGHGNTFYQANDLLPPIEDTFRARHSIYPIDRYSFEQDSLTFGSVNDRGSAGRIYGGYQFSPYFAIEGGYTQFNKTDFNAVTAIDEVNVGVGKDVYQDKYEQEITEHAFDVTGKLTLPLNYGFGAYAKAGLAYIFTRRHINDTFTGRTVLLNGNISPAGLNLNSQTSIPPLTSEALRGTWGGGLDYTIPDTNLDVDISYTQILGGDGIPKATLEALGVNYKFA